MKTVVVPAAFRSPLTYIVIAIAATAVSTSANQPTTVKRAFGAHGAPRVSPTQATIVAGRKTPRSSIAIAHANVGPAR